MNIDNLDTAKWVVWGLKKQYSTHTHIHEGFYRALKFMGKQVLWMDPRDSRDSIDFSNTIFLTSGRVLDHDKANPIPKRKDCFYAACDGTEILPKILSGYDYMDWGVNPAPSITESIPTILWATDLLPPEIEANKPDRVFRENSKVVHWVGTVWGLNDTYLAKFAQPCGENGISFKVEGAGQGPVSIEENVRLIRESYMAPAITGEYQTTRNYVPCRIYKNISYGQYGVVNSPFINEHFGGRLILSPGSLPTFYAAKERLGKILLKDLHDLMDEVAQKHTYVNRIQSLTEAIRLRLK